MNTSTAIDTPDHAAVIQWIAQRDRANSGIDGQPRKSGFVTLDNGKHYQVAQSLDGPLVFEVQWTKLETGEFKPKLQIFITKEHREKALELWNAKLQVESELHITTSAKQKTARGL